MAFEARLANRFPELTDEFIAMVSDRYIELYEKLPARHLSKPTAVILERIEANIHELPRKASPHETDQPPMVDSSPITALSTRSIVATTITDIACYLQNAAALPIRPMSKPHWPMPWPNLVSAPRRSRSRLKRRRQSHRRAVAEEEKTTKHDVKALVIPSKPNYLPKPNPTSTLARPPMIS